MNTLRAAAVAFLIVAHLSPALARPDDADPDVLIMRGLDLRRAGRSADALALFRRAYEASPSPRTLGQMGLVESSLQLWADAEAHLGAALATPNDAWVHRNRQFLDQASDRTKEHMGDLVITGPPGTKVSLGERAIGALPLAAPLRLVEGDVAIHATSGAYAAVLLGPLDQGRRACGRLDRARANRSGRPRSCGSGPRVDRSAGETLATVDGDDPRSRRSRSPDLGNRLDGAGPRPPRLRRGPPAACPTTYDTKTSGILLAAGGGAVALAGGALLYSGLHPAPLNVTLGMTTHSLRLEARF